MKLLTTIVADVGRVLRSRRPRVPGVDSKSDGLLQHVSCALASDGTRGVLVIATIHDDELHASARAVSTIDDQWCDSFHASHNAYLFLMNDDINDCVSERDLSVIGASRVEMTDMSLTLPQDKARQLHASLKRYLTENVDDEIGDLKTTLMLEFILTEIAPTIYNQAIADAQTYFQGRVADLEAVCYEEEFGYWPKVRRSPASGRQTSE